MSFLKDDGVSFGKQCTSIRKPLEGYQLLRLPDKRQKRPSFEYHVQKNFMHCVDVNNYTSSLPGCALLIRYMLPLTPGEVRCQPNLDEKSLHDESITWHPKFENPQGISIKVKASKTNRWKHETKIIHALYNCDEPMCIISCLVPLLQHWINM